MDIDQKIKLLQNHLEAAQWEKEGKEIQVRDIREGRPWHKLGYSTSKFDCLDVEFRLKPEPQKLYVNCYPDGLICAHFTEESAKANACPQVIRKSFIELTPEVEEILKNAK